MRRGFGVVGIVLAVAVGVAACGGGSSAPTIPQPGALRQALIHTEVPELKKQGRSEKVIACVERSIEATPEREIAQMVLRSVTGKEGEQKPRTESLGPLGKGCF